ncbi:erythromycin esterase family protein [Myxococcota bacterium]|nr:erythromycin esterase family protein [Myxococcota bacterium]
MAQRTRGLIAGISKQALPLSDGTEDYGALVQEIGDARFVLLGEASHGTHEFYRARAEITKRLIREKGFTAVAVEADWPDALLVNRYVRGGKPLASGRTLESFTRFPSWMWRNADVLEFVHWLRAHNDRVRDPLKKAGFYGLDLYSAIPPPIEGDDGAVPSRAGEIDGQRGPSLALLIDEQQKRLERNSTAYFEAVYKGHSQSWNLRERHMIETMEALVTHHDFAIREGKSKAPPVKMVVWEHNSHVGDARATQMGRHGELSLGQLMRERYPNETFLVGFTTYRGTVIAASGWGAKAEKKLVRPAHPDSFEATFHEVGLPRFMLSMRRAADVLGDPRLERAIGAVYIPEAELENHYFLANLPQQFDAVIHIDETKALVPLDARAA